MPQDYQQLVGTDTFSDSYVILNDSDSALKSFFSGSSEPSGLEAYQPWMDTSGSPTLLKVRNASNDGWITVGELAADFGHLSKDGGTMTAPGSGGTGIDMNGAAITNLPLGSGTSVARQQEVDLKAPINSPTFTTDAKLAVDPPTADSLTRRSYNDGKYLPLAGGTATGQITMNVAASSANHVMRKNEFDAEFLVTGHAHDGVSGEGRRILATDLDPASATDYQVLSSDGGGNCVWRDKRQMLMLDAPTNVITANTNASTYFGNSNNFGAWAEEELSGLGDDRETAWIQLLVGTNGTVTLNHYKVAVRQTGLSTATSSAVQYFGTPDTNQATSWQAYNDAYGGILFPVKLDAVSGGAASFDWALSVDRTGPSTPLTHIQIGMWWVAIE